MSNPAYEVRQVADPKDFRTQRLAIAIDGEGWTNVLDNQSVYSRRQPCGQYRLDARGAQRHQRHLLVARQGLHRERDVERRLIAFAAAQQQSISLPRAGHVTPLAPKA